jgi:hypothetical protein
MDLKQTMLIPTLRNPQLLRRHCPRYNRSILIFNLCHDEFLLQANEKDVKLFFSFVKESQQSIFPEGYNYYLISWIYLNTNIPSYLVLISALKKHSIWLVTVISCFDQPHLRLSLWCKVHNLLTTVYERQSLLGTCDIDWEKKKITSPAFVIDGERGCGKR